jgi:hypothetical protein
VLTVTATVNARRPQPLGLADAQQGINQLVSSATIATFARDCDKLSFAGMRKTVVDKVIIRVDLCCEGLFSKILPLPPIPLLYLIHGSIHGLKHTSMAAEPSMPLDVAPLASNLILMGEQWRTQTPLPSRSASTPRAKPGRNCWLTIPEITPWP